MYLMIGKGQIAQKRPYWGEKDHDVPMTKYLVVNMYSSISPSVIMLLITWPQQPSVNFIYLVKFIFFMRTTMSPVPQPPTPVTTCQSVYPKDCPLNYYLLRVV